MLSPTLRGWVWWRGRLVFSTLNLILLPSAKETLEMGCGQGSLGEKAILCCGRES